MSRPATAHGLLRSIGLLVDGPVTWGQSVPSRSPGVFVVEIAGREDVAPIDITAVRAWIERVPGLLLDGERPTPTQLADRLAAFWLPREPVLYVGRTAKALGPRVAALYQNRLGDRQPHAGGHWLKTLREPARLRLWWAETPAGEEYEDAITTAVAESIGAELRSRLPDSAIILPWANLETAMGERKATGLSGALRSDRDDGSATGPGAVTAAAAVSSATLPRAVGGATSVPRRAAALPSSRARGSSPARPPSGSPPGSRSPRAATKSGSAPQSAVPTHVTAAGLAALEFELDELRTVRRSEVILRVKHARELGDLRENADYEAARNEQSFLEGRIRELEHRIRTATVIATDHTGEVMLGSRVVVEKDGERETFDIVGSTEAEPGRGRISNVSPVGRALLGHRVGDEVAVVTPRHGVRYRIVEVLQHQP